MPVELVAPMASTRSPALGAKGAAKFCKDAQRPSRGEVRQFPRPEWEQTR
jgi:hypothetical protein